MRLLIDAGAKPSEKVVEEDAGKDAVSSSQVVIVRLYKCLLETLMKATNMVYVTIGSSFRERSRKTSALWTKLLANH